MASITINQTLPYLIFLCLLITAILSNKRKLFTIQATLPSNTYKIPSLSSGDTFLYNIALDSTQVFQIYITQQNSPASPISIIDVNSSSYSSSMTVTSNGNYYIQLRGINGTNGYSLAVTVNSVVFYGDVGLAEDYRVGLYYFVVEESCANAKFVSNNYDVINLFGVLEPNKLPISTSIYNHNLTQYAVSSNFTIDLSMAGQHAFIVGSSLYPNQTYIIKQTISVDIICFDHVCGDEFREGWEQCDNGNMSGCVNCVADPSYSCGGDTSMTACPCYTSSYSYNTGSKQCEINCKNVRYGLELVSGTNDECTCQAPSCFDTAFSKCRLGCPPVKVQTRFLMMGLVIGLSILGLIIVVVLVVKCYKNRYGERNDVRNQIGQLSSDKIGEINQDNGNNVDPGYNCNNQWVIEDAN